MKFITLLVALFSCMIGYSQIDNTLGDTLFINSYNICTLEDQSNNIAGTFNGNLPNACVCGVNETMGLRLNGDDNYIEYPGESINAILDTTFSLSFYIRPSNRDSIFTQVILSHRKTCDRDSSFSFEYFPRASQFVVQFSQDDFTPALELVADINPNDCWYYVTLVKNDNIARLYIGEELADEIRFSRPFSLSEDAQLKIADSPCINANIHRFDGSFDDLVIRKGALNGSQIGLLDFRPDKILSRDTTIFIGEELDIKSSPTCSGLIRWSPVDGLSDFTRIDPTAKPDTTITYTLTLDYTTCITSDSIRVNVVSENISCTQLLLPGAFTPNGDGINDSYGISSVFLVEDLISFEIFDKWGSMMFRSEDKNGQWDGTFNNKQIDPGMFFYKVRYLCKGKEQINTGSFALIN